MEMSVNQFLKREGLETLDTVQDEEGNTKAPYFSWSPCDACNTDRGGERYDCHGFHTESKSVVGGYEICPDCLWEAEYGTDLPDNAHLEQ
jgi:hypothetical protein